MYNYPRRPYVRYSDNAMPRESVQENDVPTIESNRFWSLWRELQKRRENVKVKNKNAPTV